MSPREEFNRTKRWAGLAAAFLIAHLFAGVKQSDSGGLFGITLENPSALDEVFFLLLLVFTVKAINIWTMLDDQYRTKIQYIIDDLFSVILSIIASVMYIVNQDYRFPNIGITINENIEFLLALVATIIGFISAFIPLNKLRSIRVSANLRADVKIIQMLLVGDWYLVFANARARATKGQVGWKKISFEEDGLIGEGKNKNECTWRVKNGYLEIYNENNEIFSRFVLSGEGFKATDDSDVKALPGQEIVRDIEIWKQKEE